MSADLKAAVALARKLKEEAPKSFVAPPVGTRPANEYLLPFALVRGTRGYVEKVVNQVNGCYEKGWFDGCAVMMRRLVETLIIECFEHHHIDHKIKNVKGDFLRLPVFGGPDRQDASGDDVESRPEFKGGSPPLEEDRRLLRTQ